MEYGDAAGPDLPIAAVSKSLGIPIPTIRSWERRYGFPAPRRTDGRHRRYSEREVEQLRELRDLIVRGHGAREAVQRVAAAVRTGGNRLADEVVDAAMRLDPDGIRSALDRGADRMGVEATIRDVAFVAMREIGAGWKVGHVDVEQEHLASHAVRTWLGRHAALAPPAFRGGTIVLACGPKELHSIGIEAFAVILARRGWPIRVLGAMTPSRALVSAVSALEAIGAVVTAHRGVTRRAAIDSLEAVEALPGVRAFYAGNAFASPTGRRGVPGSYLGEDVLDAALLVEAEVGIPVRGGRSQAPHRAAFLS